MSALCQDRDHFPYGVCNKKVVSNAIECSLCKTWIHFKCAHIKYTHLKYFEGDAHWICHSCNINFPYSTLSNQEFMCEVDSCSLKFSSSYYSLLEKCQEFRLDQNPYDEDKYDYDDSYSCNNIYSSVSKDCKYYTESHFNNQFHAHCGFSLMHLNARSIKKNMLDVVHVLDCFTLKFDVIAVTETWFESCDVDGYDIDGYKVIHVIRKTKLVKVGVLRPVQQPGSYWDRSSELPLVGLEPTEVTAYD